MSRCPAYAQTITKSAALSTEFGLSYATRLFGSEAIESLSRLKSGPNKGHPKGHIIWQRTTTAGYHPTMGRGVGPGVTVRAWISESPIAPETAAVRGAWMGRLQPLCGSACVLTQAYRDEDAREQAQRKADWEAEKAEMLVNA